MTTNFRRRLILGISLYGVGGLLSLLLLWRALLVPPQEVVPYYLLGFFTTSTLVATLGLFITFDTLLTATKE